LGALNPAANALVLKGLAIRYNDETEAIQLGSDEFAQNVTCPDLHIKLLSFLDWSPQTGLGFQSKWE
jgi:hypothetical protein